MPEHHDLHLSNDQNLVNVNKYFVFVVCGAAEHINTLHFSLKILQRFTNQAIIIVTDSSRNELNIIHDKVIDFPTPSTLSNHQAAIYLKTSLHRILPEEALYCYLDTDVIAVKPDVDSIFEQYDAPIAFCTDHCKIKAFSPNAIQDTFYDNLLSKQTHLSELYFQYWQEEAAQIAKAGAHLSKIQELKTLFNQKRPIHAQSLQGKTSPNVLLAKMMYWILSGLAWLPNIFKRRNPDNTAQRLERLHRSVFKTPLNFSLFLQEHGYYFDLAAEKWYDLKGELLYEENLIVKRIQAVSAFRWDMQAQIWRDEAGYDISNIESDKLLHLIKSKFDVTITDENWRHWNGGVFLFDRQSYAFLEQWHEWTLEILEDSQWKTRDQGTLIATAWKFGLQNHSTLPIVYNLIADFYHPDLSYQGNLCFSFASQKPDIYPCLLHLYHHWGDLSWQLWRDVEQLYAEKKQK